MQGSGFLRDPVAAVDVLAELVPTSDLEEAMKVSFERKTKHVS